MGSTASRRRRVRWQVRLVLLLALALPAAVTTRAQWRGASAAYDREVQRLGCDAAYRDAALEQKTRPQRADTLDAMGEQNALLFQWAIVLLGAVAALVTTSKVHRIGQVDTVYVLLAPAAIFLLGSIGVGIDFQRSLTYLVSKDRLHVPALNDFLFQQGELLFWSLRCLAAFVVVFYLFIVFGGVRPTEDDPDIAKETP